MEIFYLKINMKQPKDDDRYEVNNPRITKGQHIIPANIIKKWKQKDKDGRLKLLTQIKFTPKSDPKIQWFSDEGRDDFCVYHRWSQSFEVNANKFVEQPFFKLIDELEKDERDIIKFDFIKDKDKALTIIDYYLLIKRRMYFKLNNSNEVFKNFVGVKSGNYTKEEQETLERKHVSYYFNNQMIGMEWISYLMDTQFNRHCSENDVRTLNEHQNWFYIRIHDKTSRFVLPDNWNNQQIISVSPYSIFISQAFINYLYGFTDYLQFLDIKNPPIPIRKIVRLSSIINRLALCVYDKWLIH